MGNGCMEWVMFCKSDEGTCRQKLNGSYVRSVRWVNGFLWEYCWTWVTIIRLNCFMWIGMRRLAKWREVCFLEASSYPGTVMTVKSVFIGGWYRTHGTLAEVWKAVAWFRYGDLLLTVLWKRKGVWVISRNGLHLWVWQREKVYIIWVEMFEKHGMRDTDGLTHEGGCWNAKELACRVDRRVLRWFGQTKRVDEGWLVNGNVRERELKKTKKKTEVWGNEGKSALHDRLQGRVGERYWQCETGWLGSGGER